jgi:hypothetical protein
MPRCIILSIRTGGKRWGLSRRKKTLIVLLIFASSVLVNLDAESSCGPPSTSQLAFSSVAIWPDCTLLEKCAASGSWEGYAVAEGLCEVPDFGDALHRRQHVATILVHVLYTLGSGLHIARHDFLHTSGYPFRLPEDSLVGVVG